MSDPARTLHAPPLSPRPIVIGLTLAVLAYPWLLRAFLAALGPAGAAAPPAGLAAAFVLMSLVFATPAAGLALTLALAEVEPQTQALVRLRRFGHACVAAPTAFCFVGVSKFLLHSPLPDEAVWTLLWLAISAWALAGRQDITPPEAAAKPGGLRVAHGVSGAVILVYVAFHLFNHLFGWLGPEAHARIMELGRRVYRAPAVEAALVAAFLFQVLTGLRLAWYWSGLAVDRYRTVQVASGFFLSLYILGHMNSVFVYARTVGRIETGWGFATGAPLGLLHDPWSVRLIPHYALAVFFVLVHLASGLRGVLLAHGAAPALVNRAWAMAAALSAATAVVILAGMCGARLG